ncbi:hypothetical protein D8674_028580 [Pyrus ussuriensis x Pyrus communis]|uniref:Uncharacterized protein n=1 Tax=Pyrus ussuriensis x Pyrus communis TaxID=2448454 RepID=A0A5N5HZP5_9ROSA|nr:hypothetical protein D8674_028580 [Pyrus ussuriensis x Pyrus communis]
MISSFSNESNPQTIVTFLTSLYASLRPLIIQERSKTSSLSSSNAGSRFWQISPRFWQRSKSKTTYTIFGKLDQTLTGFSVLILSNLVELGEIEVTNQVTTICRVRFEHCMLRSASESKRSRNFGLSRNPPTDFRLFPSTF